MTQHVLLDNINHKDLKVSPLFKAEFGDKVNTALTFPTELGDVQKEYPVFMRKDEASGEFQLVVMLGFEQDENLFLNEQDHTWNAEYVPAVIAKGPFLIGFQDQTRNGGVENAPVVHVDMANPRIDNENGIAVFLEHGGNSPYLENINAVLFGIYQGMAASKAMLAAFSHLDLIEPVNLDVTLNNGNKHTLRGNYTISSEKLAALDGASLEKLNKAGFLQGAYLIMTSLNNLKRLIALKNSQ